MMPDIRYFEERPCPHGEMEEHYTCDDLNNVEWAAHEKTDACLCPGGSRREVIVDYHGAATRLGEVKNDPDAYAAAVRIVNQALGRGDTQEKDAE